MIVPHAHRARAVRPACGPGAIPGLRHLGTPLAVDLWIADLDAPSGTTSASLDAAEHARAARFVFEHDRRRYLVAHSLLRQLLALRTGIPDTALSIETGSFGKPYLAGRPGCAFNLSHSGGVALIGLADEGGVGVDVEVLRPTPDVDALVRSHFSADERRTMESVAQQSRDLAFLVGWTRKEACLKAVGVGLNIEPASIDAGVTLAERSVRIEGPELRATVVVRSLVCDGRAVCAVARTSSP